MIILGTADSISSPTANVIFLDDFTSTSSIDMANSKTAGFKWYLEQWWENGTTNVNNISQTGSVLTLGGGTGRGRLQSAISLVGSQSYIGNTWGVAEIYFDVRMRFNPANTNVPGFFGIYLFDIASIYDVTAVGDAQWPGQPSGFGHFMEADMFELAGFMPDNSYNGKQTYQGTIHDWSGLYDGSTWERNIYNANSLIDLGAPPDWTQFHDYGLHWLPQVGTTPGKMQWYFDGIPRNATYWLGPPGTPPLPGYGTPHTSTTVDQDAPGKATRTFSVLDSHRLAMQLDGNPQLPIELDWVKVWNGVPPAP